MIKRFALFFLTNILIVVTLSILLGILGVGNYLTASGLDYGALMAFCFIWGMVGSFISLAISRLAAKWFMGVKVIPVNSAGELGWLVNTVHQLAKRAGLPAMPEVGIYSSPEVNAFATGPTKSRSLVAVSEGLLRGMSKDEIEGVLAHEVAHIQNGDMVTMTLVQGVVNAFVMFLARVISFAISNAGRSEDSRPAMNYFITMALEMVLGLLGFIIVCWFSRKREFRADAGAATLAGREKMAAALERLASYHGVRHVANENNSFATMKIDGSTSAFLHLFATHPPIEERIRRLRNFQ